MAVPKIAIRAAKANPGSDQSGPKRNRTRQFLFLTFGAGALSGLVALIGPGLLTVAGAAITTHVATTAAKPIQASAVFPPVPPKTQVIDVYDPAPPVKRAAPAPAPAPAAAPPAAVQPSPTPTHRPSPIPSPTPQRSPRPTPSGSPRPTPPPND
jgi:outer membrane biosynthesis protein TonB